MIADVTGQIQAYMSVCKADNTKPTIYGLADKLGVNKETLRHIRLGVYKKGKPYTATPHPKRCIDNSDFETIIQAMEQCKS